MTRESTGEFSLGLRNGIRLPGAMSRQRIFTPFLTPQIPGQSALSPEIPWQIAG